MSDEADAKTRLLIITLVRLASAALIGVGIAMIMIALDYFRRGSIVLSASVLLAAFLRLLLPDSDAGMLVVRSRKVDVLTLAVLGVGLTIFTFWVPAPS